MAEQEDYARQHLLGSTGVPHYHGDLVRQVFMIASAAMLLGLPFYGDSLRLELPFVLVGGLVLIALAALTNPHAGTVMYASAIASGVGLAIYQTWALFSYDESTWTQFLLREVVALLFLVAFYFSMKTVRALIFHQIGKHEEAGEFDEPQAR
ncbi:MAG: hypothetical protein HYS26_02915 [Candidatus Kaiserbacteria bacterium]|nr:MAG: hypothetical protein HYS26_02915 [Candidatus Kaiserbacteria bacterium]